MQKLHIIAGPCSVDYNNLKEILEIGSLEVTNLEGKNQLAICGTRVVGLKSRTEFEPETQWIGLDLEAWLTNMNLLTTGHTSRDFVVPPSVILAKQIWNETKMLIATEVCHASTQLPVIEKEFANLPHLIWNCAVMQLGHPVLEMGIYAKRNSWIVGNKNGKWLDMDYQKVETADFVGQTSMEKTWLGLGVYARTENRILISRGVDMPKHSQYRNVPLHFTAIRSKIASGKKMFFDPSHIYGPKMKAEIVRKTINAMKLKMPDGSYLYDGILVETGTAKSDTGQHITVSELGQMAQQIANFRPLATREESYNLE